MLYRHGTFMPDKVYRWPSRSISCTAYFLLFSKQVCSSVYEDTPIVANGLPKIVQNRARARNINFDIAVKVKVRFA